MADDISGRLEPIAYDTVGKTEAGKKIVKDMLAGVQVGEAILGPEGLGRASTDPEIKQILERQKEQSVMGLSSREYLAKREKAMQGISQAGATGQRDLQARLARMGVRGGMAGQQMSSLIAQQSQQRAGVERDLFLESAGIQRQAFKDFAKSQAAVTNFDLQQQAKEKAALLGAGTSISQLGQAERAGQAAANAQIQAAKHQSAGGGGDTSFVCSALREKGLMSKEESMGMFNFMLESLIGKNAQFWVWYFYNGYDLAMAMLERNDIDWNEVKKESVEDVLNLVKENKKDEARVLYGKAIMKYAKLCGFNMPEFTVKPTYLTLPLLPLIFLMPKTIKFIKSRGFFKLTKNFFKQTIRRFAII